MLLAGEGFRDVCACMRPRGFSWERWWDGVLARGSHPSRTPAKHAGVPQPGTPIAGRGPGSQQVLTDKMGTRWLLGLGVKNAQWGTKKRGEWGQWKEAAGGDMVGVPNVPPSPCPSSSLPLGNDPDAMGSAL